MSDPIIDAYLSQQYEKAEKNVNEKCDIVRSNQMIKLNLFQKNENIALCVHPFSANYGIYGIFHQHSFFELVYMYHGSGIQYFPDQSVCVESGDICLLNTNTRHACSINDKDSLMLNIMIGKDYMEHTFLPSIIENDLFSSFFLNSLFSNTGNEQYLLFKRKEHSKTDFFMNAFLHEYSENKPCAYSAMQSYLSLLFTDIFRDHIFIAENPSKDDKIFKDILSYMNDNLETITLNCLAENFHYNPSYLSRLFKKNTGRGFSEILSELKLNKASLYLKNSSLSIDSIVELLGYYDRSYFNKAFKKKYGFSPNTLRK